MAATDFMRGAAPTPWWHYTAQRKLVYGAGLSARRAAARPARATLSRLQPAHA